MEDKTTEYILQRLDILSRKLEEEGSYTRANTAYLAIEEIKRLQNALNASVNLQTHYAELLNAHDGGERLTFKNAEAWLQRLQQVQGPNNGN